MYSQGYRPPSTDAQAQPAQGAWYAPPPSAKPAPRAAKAGGPKRAPQRGGGRKPAKKRSAKRALIGVAVLVVLLAAASAGVYLWKVNNDVRPYMSRFLDNVSVDGIDLTGMTWAEGSAAVWAQANEKQNGWYVRLVTPTGDSKAITAQTLGISFDPTEALQAAWAVGHSGDGSGRLNVFDVRKEIESAKATPREYYSVKQSADASQIDTILQAVEAAAYKPATDAQLLSFNPDDTTNPFAYQYEEYGQYLDTSAVREQILNMAHTLTSGEVLLTPTPVAPQVTVADLEQHVAVRYRAVTPVSTASTEDRTNNIRVAFAKINGKVLQDGAKFSFNTVVGNRTEKNGFGQAIEYAYGLERLGWGGGVCQASTTMYLAAIQSGMTIVKRVAHSNPVSYTDLGKDATVNDTKGHEVDFVFRNDSGGPVYIAAHVIPSGNSKKRFLCEVILYGPSLGDTRYELVTETVETLAKPSEPTLEPDENAQYVTYEDETKQISKGRDGYVVDAYLCTFQNDVEISRVKVSTDTYPARADRYWVGVTPRIAY